MRILIITALLLLSGCVQYTDKRGVEVTWQPEAVSNFTIGETSRSDVLKALGPPSQIITLDDETVLYYLYEKSAGEGYILIIYNRFEVETKYDRAVFFFDGNDRLTEYASHINPEDDD